MNKQNMYLKLITELRQSAFKMLVLTAYVTFDVSVDSQSCFGRDVNVAQEWFQFWTTLLFHTYAHMLTLLPINKLSNQRIYYAYRPHCTAHTRIHTHKIYFTYSDNILVMLQQTDFNPIPLLNIHIPANCYFIYTLSQTHTHVYTQTAPRYIWEALHTKILCRWMAIYFTSKSLPTSL